MFDVRSITLWAAGLAALTFGACSGTEIELTAEKTQVTAGGIDSTTITATVLRMGDPAAGARVNFETTAGSFDKVIEEDEREVTTNALGVATVQLYSAKRPTTATVTATFDDEVSSMTAVSSLSIDFVTAGGDALPLGERLRMDCDAVNIGALRTPTPDIRVTCRLTGETADNRIIPGGALDPELFAEAGTMVIGEDDDSGERVVFYSPRGGKASPRDVSYLEGAVEPNYVDDNGKSRNPRDGLVTLMAVVDGQEGFEDLNGNGLYDRGEVFFDAPEPFLDENDNGTHDATEPYVDVDGNGKWDAANGSYDLRTKIMALFKILWTGPLHNEQSSFDSATSRIDIGEQATRMFDGGRLDMRAFALDRNLNPIAAFSEAGDELEWNVESQGDAQAFGETDQTMQNAYGFEFDRAAETELLRWRITARSFLSQTYNLSLQDSRIGDEVNPTAYSVNVQVNVTPGRDTDGSFLEQLTEKILDEVKGLAD